MKIFKAVAMLLILCGGIANAQVNRCSYLPPRQGDNWLFAQNANLRFDETGPTVIIQDNNIRFPGSACISDEEGNLVLFTDGWKVYNKNFQDITLGEDLLGHISYNQMALIVPNPVSKQMYYIFTTDNPEHTKGFNMYRVDMTLNGNQGGVMRIDSLLLPKSAGMLTGIANQDKTGYWVVTHGVDNADFYSFKVTSSGLVGKFKTTIGPEISGIYDSEQYIGGIKISPKGDKLAMVSYGGLFIELFDFNNNTGAVTNNRSIPLPYTPTATTGPSYLQFSADGSKLYVNFFNMTDPYLSGRLYQFDVSVPESEIGSSAVWLNDPAKGFQYPHLSAMQLARDGKIYMSSINSKTLCVIENPNRSGDYCNYRESVYLMNTNLRYGMPNFIESFFDVPPVDYDTKCFGDETEFYILNKSNTDLVSWNFGDPDSDDNEIAGVPLSDIHSHKFSKPGQFMVTLTEITSDGDRFPTSFPVYIDELPPKSFETDDLLIFPGSTIPLDAGPDMFSYQWTLDGRDVGSDQYFNATEAGLYIAEYTDINCCTNRDTLEVIPLNIKLPTAFIFDGTSPDEVNRRFKTQGPTEGIQDFTLVVYNRWGQLVWETRNSADYWDGTFKGEPAPAGLYAWNMTFNVTGNITDIGKVTYRGVVTLLRK